MPWGPRAILSYQNTYRINLWKVCTEVLVFTKNTSTGVVENSIQTDFTNIQRP